MNDAIEDAIEVLDELSREDWAAIIGMLEKKGNNDASLFLGELFDLDLDKPKIELTPEEEKIVNEYADEFNSTVYSNYIESKRLSTESYGFEVNDDDLNPMLFDWQKEIVKWALRQGRCALFEDCGLGKTPQQLEWAKHVNIHTGKPVLIFAPLAVAQQTQREGDKFGIEVTICETQSDIVNGINITNYEKLHLFTPDGLGGGRFR